MIDPEKLVEAARNLAYWKRIAKELKRRRNTIFQSGKYDCSDADSMMPCYVLSKDKAQWCENCRLRQPYQEAYRSAARKAGAAIKKVTSMFDDEESEKPIDENATKCE